MGGRAKLSVLGSAFENQRRIDIGRSFLSFGLHRHPGDGAASDPPLSAGSNGIATRRLETNLDINHDRRQHVGLADLIADDKVPNQGHRVIDGQGAAVDGFSRNLSGLPATSDNARAIRVRSPKGISNAGNHKGPLLLPTIASAAPCDEPSR